MPDEAVPREHTSAEETPDTRGNERDDPAEGEEGDQWINWSFGTKEVRVDARRALIGGALAALTTVVGAWLVGRASGAEAQYLLEMSLPRTRSLCSTVVLATSTILALMLTLLSMSTSADVDLKSAHYQRVKQIAWFATITLIMAMLSYLLLNVPLGEADKASQNSGPWFEVLYYATLGISSVLGGALIAVVLMLFNTVRDIIKVVGLGEESHLVRTDEE